MGACRFEFIKAAFIFVCLLRWKEVHSKDLCKFWHLVRFLYTFLFMMSWNWSIMYLLIIGLAATLILCFPTLSWVIIGSTCGTTFRSSQIWELLEEVYCASLMNAKYYESISHQPIYLLMTIFWLQSFGAALFCHQEKLFLFSFCARKLHLCEICDEKCCCFQLVITSFFDTTSYATSWSELDLRGKSCKHLYMLCFESEKNAFSKMCKGKNITPHLCGPYILTVILHFDQ